MEKKSIPIYYVHRTQLLTEEVLKLKTVRGLESILEKTTLWPQLTVSNTLYFSLDICFGPHLETGAWARWSDHRSDKLQLSLYLVLTYYSCPYINLQLHMQIIWLFSLLWHFKAMVMDKNLLG